MTIEIQRSELETLIQQRMRSGGFRSVEDVLIDALLVAAAMDSNDERTGAELITAMQACPVQELDMEPERFPMPVRDVTF